MKNKRIPKIFRTIFMIFGLAMVLFQFLPFWSVNGESVSIFNYIWFPKSNKELTAMFQTMIDPSFTINSVGGAPIAAMCFGALTVVLCITKKRFNLIQTGFAIASSVGALLCLGKPVILLGSIWWGFAVLGIPFLAAALVYAFFFIKDYVSPQDKRK